MIVHRYLSSSGRDLIMEYIDSLEPDEQVDAMTVMQKMEDNKWEELYTKQWQDKIWEVYFYCSKRIFYVIADGDNVYLLHACKKQKNKTERRDVNKVINRAKELGKVLGIQIVR